MSESCPRKAPGESSDEKQFMQVIAIIDPADAEAIGGLPAESIAGLLPQSRPSQKEPVSSQSLATGFRPNSVFAAFMHHVIRTHGPQDPDLQSAAQQQKEGYLYVIDFRTPDGIMGRVPPEDIVGAFAVKDGRIGAYEPNKSHKIFSENGLVKLPPPLAKIHIEEIKRCKVTQRQ